MALRAGLNTTKDEVKMASVNKAIVLGNVGRDPDTRYTASGDAVCSFSIATTEKWSDKTSGEKKESTEWHRITIFGKLAEMASNYVRKGTQVYVEGKISTRKWTDKSGVERYSTDIIASDLKMLGSKPSGEQQEKKFEGGAATGAPKGDFSDMDDDIPFLLNELYNVPTVVSKAFMRARRVR